MRRRTVVLVAVAAVVAAGLVAAGLMLAGAGTRDGGSKDRPAARSGPSARTSRPALAPRPVTVPVDGFASWALLDRATGDVSGSDNLAATSTTESMIKAWIVADHLRRTAAAGRSPDPARLRQASVAIRDSDDAATQSLYEDGGRDAVVERMIRTCGLTDTAVVDGRWSRTRMSARDAVRMGACVADGRAAGPVWTPWVLTEMERVRGTTAAEDQRQGSGGGRWGIIDGLPPQLSAEGVAIKNGWTPVAEDGLWHVNCLAIGRDWVLAVLLRYPIPRGLDYGAHACADVARQLVVWPPTADG